ncbi:MAG: hypothetical protein VX938_02345, partial [Myxococcota bacterium]|nr:hypothetical protein [Myxococcota bacterium]
EVEMLSEVLGHEDPAPGEAPLPELSASARMTYFFMNGKRTNTQIARTSGLALFEVYLALQELLKAHLVTLVTTHSKGEPLQLRKPVLPILVSGLTTLLLGACLLLGGQWVVQNHEDLKRSLAATSPSITATVDRANKRHLEQSLRLYELRHRSFPEDLGELVSGGYVEPAVGQSFKRLRYESTPVGYVLTSRPGDE